jgi:hypothetical protein
MSKLFFLGCLHLMQTSESPGQPLLAEYLAHELSVACYLSLVWLQVVLPPLPPLQSPTPLELLLLLAEPHPTSWWAILLLQVRQALVWCAG